MRIHKILPVFLLVLFLSAGTSFAFFLDFEDGSDGADVTDIDGVSFTDFNGFPAIYGDSRVGYNTTSDDLGYGGGIYHHNGNFFLWAGAQADAQGTIVDFTNNDGTYFQTGYSSFSTFFVEAYLTDGSMVTANGVANTGGPMDFLRIDATDGLFIDYIVLHDTGNMWLVDDMSGDASGVGVPEPSALLLLGPGLLGLAIIRRKNLLK